MGRLITLDERFFNAHITFSSVAEIKELSSSLVKLGLTYFTFDRTYQDGTHLRLTNHGKWIETYYRDKLYDRAVFEKDPRLFTNGHVFWDFLNREPIYSAAAEHDIDHGLTIVEVHSLYSDFYHLGTQCDNPIPKQFLVAKLELLYQFIAFFKQKAKKIIEKAELDRFILPSSQRESIKAVEMDELKINNTITELIKDKTITKLYLGAELDNAYLTRREIDVLSLLMRGKKAKNAAAQLGLSVKTLEAQIKHIKNKLQCKTLFEVGFVLGELSAKHIFPFKIT